MTPRSIKEMNALALDELRAVIDGIDEGQVEALLAGLAKARRIACYGVGREGLMMKALAMRLYHLGLDVHVVGDMTTPPLTVGDLLLVSAGPGHFSTVQALLETARNCGAATACFTAEPTGRSPAFAGHVVVLPAQTMARDQAAPSSFLPMGSLYEGAQYLFFEYLVLMVRDRLGVTAEAMRGRHTNLE
jgi:6-phospho-3-hexuloisomerase